MEQNRTPEEMNGRDLSRAEVKRPERSSIGMEWNGHDPSCKETSRDE